MHLTASTARGVGLWRSLGLRLAVLAAGLAAATTARAEPAEPLAAIVDRIAGPAAQDESIPGLVVGVSWHGRRSVFGYSGTGDTLPDAATIVEIGSITKLFTTALFGEALIERRMLRDEPFGSYLKLTLQPCAAQVTVEQLANFTSGMPLLPGNAPKNLEERGLDHYTREDFLRWVSRWSPADASGCELPQPYRYSNASVGLLGLIVAERLGAPWPQLVHERITGPLGMTSTSIEVRESDRDRLAQGHRFNSSYAPPWPVFAWFAAGALRSTTSDMLSFGEAALGHEQANGKPVPARLREALKIAMAPAYQPEDQTFMMGMAWNMEPSDPAENTRPVWFKAGGTDGFNTVLVVNPAKDLVVFVAANKAQTHIPQLGVRLSRFIRRD